MHACMAMWSRYDMNMNMGWGDEHEHEHEGSVWVVGGIGVRQGRKV